VLRRRAVLWFAAQVKVQVKAQENPVLL